MKICSNTYGFWARIRVVIYNIVKYLLKKDWIIDISGIILTPSKNGELCKGNGEHKNWRGKIIECCCDECDYLMYCASEYEAL